MRVPKAAILICILLAAVGVGGWQSSKHNSWEYAVVEVGSVSQMTSNVFYLDQDGYHDINLGAGHSQGSSHDGVSSNTDARLRMTGKALAMLGKEGWELVGTGPPVADNPYMTFYLKRPRQ